MKYEPALVLLVLGCVFLSGCIDGGMPQTPPPYFNVNYYLNGTNETLKIYVKNNTNLNYVIYGDEGFFNYLQANNFTGGLIDTTYGYFQIVDIYNATMDVAYIGNLSGGNATFKIIRGQNLYINNSIYGADITVDNVYAGNLYGSLDASYIDNAPWLTATDQRYNDTALIIGINTTINSRIDNLTLNGPWVLKTGDNMIGNLNMSNNNITDVDYLYVHNISGRSPIHILSDVISSNDITASTFFGNFSGENGTIFGVNINNGTIVNLHVTQSAVVDANMSVNGTFRARAYGAYSPITFVDENGTEIAQISGNDTFSNTTFGFIRAHEIIVDRLSILGLLNYSPTEPPDYYFADEVWINKVGNVVNFTFYFNESRLNNTLSNFTSSFAINFTALSDRIDALNNSKLEFAAAPYLYKINTTVYFNESKLNITINNISKTVSYTMFIQANVSGGTAIVTTSSIGYQITQIIVVPPTSGTKYYFLMTEYPTTSNIIDENLVKHTGTWNILKSYSLISQTQFNIIGGTVDGAYNVTIKYLNNGLQ